MRHELKFVCEEAARPRLLAELRLLPDCLKVAHPPRIVQSIYLDTLERTALHDNLAGVSRRKKLRFRWYGADCASVTGQLEYKRRTGDLGDKLVQPIGVPIAVEGRPRSAFLRDLRDAVTIEWRARLDGREPALWTSYERDYLATMDGEVRVTLDRSFRAFELRLGFTISRRDPVALPRVLIVEAKAAPEHIARLQAIASRLGIPRSKCSKFVWASAPREAPIPSRLLG